MKVFSLLIVSVVAISGCAKQPSKIVPVSMNGAYDSVSCNRAAQLYKDETVKIPSLIAAQKSAVTGDALGVFLIGIPVSSLSGADVEGEIASTKGKLLALGARLEACGTPAAQIAWG